MSRDNAEPIARRVFATNGEREHRRLIASEEVLPVRHDLEIVVIPLADQLIAVGGQQPRDGLDYSTERGATSQNPGLPVWNGDGDDWTKSISCLAYDIFDVALADIIEEMFSADFSRSQYGGW
jgi:hypothetical protein